MYIWAVRCNPNADNGRTIQRAMERSKLGISLQDKMCNTEMKVSLSDDELDMWKDRTPISGQ